MKNKQPIYVAYHINKEQIQEILKKLNLKFDEKNVNNPKDNEYHVTVAFGGSLETILAKPSNNELLEEYKKFIKSDYYTADEIQLNIVAIGKTKEGVVAFKVEYINGSKVFSSNNTPHITVYVPYGRKPFESNNIKEEEWQYLDEKIKVNNVILCNYYPYKGEKVILPTLEKILNNLKKDNIVKNKINVSI